MECENDDCSTVKYHELKSPSPKRIKLREQPIILQITDILSNSQETNSIIKPPLSISLVNGTSPLQLGRDFSTPRNRKSPSSDYSSSSPRLRISKLSPVCKACTPKNCSFSGSSSGVSSVSLLSSSYKSYRSSDDSLMVTPSNRKTTVKNKVCRNILSSRIHKKKVNLNKPLPSSNHVNESKTISQEGNVLPVEYEVESIVDFRMVDDKEYYLIKWKGYSSSENTWEPLSNLTSCKVKLRKFRNLITAGNGNFEDRRKETLKLLSEWEVSINNARPSNTAPIRVENNVDLEGPPTDFSYIPRLVASEGVTIPEVILGCDCNDGCSAKSHCCGVISESKFAYSKTGKLILPLGVPIYECNSMCSCQPDMCTNRVVQRGRQYEVCLFKTSSGKGWGVKTLENIPRNAFVMEYIGEIVMSEEAERRGKEYDARGRTYLFDLDFFGSERYTVDAALKGNEAHFINHSCDPNLATYCVWYDWVDPFLPHLAFFSKRSIPAGTELTFDYTGLRYGDEHWGNATPKSGTPRQRLPCKCGASNCRKFIYS